MIDQVSFGAQFPIYAWGRMPNAPGPFQRLTPTFGAYNRMLPGFDAERPFQLWPNPASTRVHAFVDADAAGELEVFRSDGRRVAGPIGLSAHELVELDTYGYGPGHYVMRIRTGDTFATQPFIVIP